MRGAVEDAHADGRVVLTAAEELLALAEAEREDRCADLFGRLVLVGQHAVADVLVVERIEEAVRRDDYHRAPRRRQDVLHAVWLRCHARGLETEVADGAEHVEHRVAQSHVGRPVPADVAHVEPAQRIHLP